MVGTGNPWERVGRNVHVRGRGWGVGSSDGNNAGHLGSATDQLWNSPLEGIVSPSSPPACSCVYPREPPLGVSPGVSPHPSDNSLIKPCPAAALPCQQASLRQTVGAVLDPCPAQRAFKACSPVAPCIKVLGISLYGTMLGRVWQGRHPTAIGRFSFLSSSLATSLRSGETVQGHWQCVSPTRNLPPYGGETRNEYAHDKNKVEERSA